MGRRRQSNFYQLIKKLIYYNIKKKILFVLIGENKVQ